MLFIWHPSSQKYSSLKLSYLFLQKWRRTFIIQIEPSIYNFQRRKVLYFLAIGKTEQHTQVSWRQFPILRKTQFQNKFNRKILNALKAIKNTLIKIQFWIIELDILVLYPCVKSFPEALTSVVQLVGHHPTDQRVARSIPSQGTCLSCGFGPQSGCLREGTNRCFSLT